MRCHIWLQLSLFLLATAAACQNTGDAAPITIRQLQASEVVEFTQQTSPGTLLPVKCDSKRDVYFREVVPPEVFEQPLLHFSAGGTYIETFLFSGSSTKLTSAGDFSIDGQDHVYQLAYTRPRKSYVLEYEKGGSVKRQIELQPPVDAFSLAVFPSGDFLIGGFEGREKGSASAKAQFLGVFDSSGKLVRRVNWSPPQAPAADSPQEEVDSYEIPMQTAGAVIGADGNAYFLAPRLPARLLVVSPAGELVKTLDVRSDVTAKMVPKRLHRAGTRLAVLFFGDADSERVLAVVDPSTGLIDSLYDLAPEISAALFCADENEFDFLSFKEGKRQVLRAYR